MNKEEKKKYARAFVVLVAAFITHLLNIRYQRNLLESLMILFIVIIIFYVVATIALKLFSKIEEMGSANEIKVPVIETDNAEANENETE